MDESIANQLLIIVSPFRAALARLVGEDKTDRGIGDFLGLGRERCAYW
ncbi:MAG: hypothetical protein PVH80_04745 [Anaerolineae bacterium]